MVPGVTPGGRALVPPGDFEGPRFLQVMAPCLRELLSTISWELGGGLERIAPTGKGKRVEWPASASGLLGQVWEQFLCSPSTGKNFVMLTLVPTVCQEVWKM